MLVSILQLFNLYMYENCYILKGQAWKAESWERAITYISVKRQYYFTIWDKGAKPARLGTSNRLQKLVLKEYFQHGARFVSLYYSSNVHWQMHVCRFNQDKQW